ncbi:MAG: bifunctional phosphoribosyl-AMP cyclohydrolase/phosphoribosyl-ATP diphosphatase HisIE [Clostridiales bacterium]|nr:bifunctional phosphoribosyl-AMP cyclohydrolase/phosphoribosyl-ATP diphosphatase HisIE [Clostridiales bacterium]
MLNINEIKFDDRGLIPAIVTDFFSKRVLTLAYMNRESLEISMAEKRCCFWSRSRGELWRKGETSGNFQEIVDIRADCDRDALLVRVKKAGPACHLGGDSCFEDLLFESGEAEDFSLDALYELIKGRKNQGKEGSYTSYLFEKGIDKILKKVGEESTEVIIAAKDGDKAQTIYEVSDLAYHVMVMMAELDISNEEILKELSSRSIIDKKVKQEKMT